MNQRRILLLLAVLFCVHTSFASKDHKLRREQDAPPSNLFRNTYYYLLPESDYPAAPLDAQIKDMDGNVLAQVNSGFKKALDVEGTGKLRDGRVVNFIGRVGAEVRYAFTIHPYGRGVGDCALSPFHSIAVDPKRIPLGSVVKITETVGMKLPDGTRHDGLWRAEDIGGAIQNDHIDLFVGVGKVGGTTIDQAGISNMQPLHVTVITPPPADSCINAKPQ